MRPCRRVCFSAVSTPPGCNPGDANGLNAPSPHAMVRRRPSEDPEPPMPKPAPIALAGLDLTLAVAG